MQTIRFASIFFSLVFTFRVFATAPFIYEHPRGAFFEDLPTSNKVFLGISFAEINEWQNSHFSQFGTLYTKLSQKPFLMASDRFLTLSKAANIIPLPVDKVISRELFFKPEYHQKMNPSFNLVVLSNDPLVFQTKQNIYGIIELSTRMSVAYANGQELLTLLPARNPQPFAASIRYSDDFNQALDHLITVSEFYGLNENSTLVVTYLVVGIKKNMMSSGLGSKIFRNKMKSYIHETAIESLTQLNRLLGVN